MQLRSSLASHRRRGQTMQYPRLTSVNIWSLTAHIGGLIATGFCRYFTVVFKGVSE